MSRRTSGQVSNWDKNAAVDKAINEANGKLLSVDFSAISGISYKPNYSSGREPQALTANSYGVPGLSVTNFNNQTGTIGRNQLNIQPILIVRPLTITKIAMRNIGAISVTDTTVRCGLYASNSSGKATGDTLITSDLLFATGTAAGTTVANTVSLNVDPGIYWQVFVFTGNADNSWHAFLGSVSDAIGIPNSGAPAGSGNFNNFTYAALPNATSLPSPGSRGFWATFYDWTWR
jgi:hypothetical protein